MDPLMNFIRPDSFRLNRSASKSMSDLDNCVIETSLHFNMMNVNSGHQEQRHFISRHFSCNQLYSPNSTFRTLDSPYQTDFQNQSSNWTNSQREFLSPIAKSSKSHFCNEPNYNSCGNDSINSLNVKHFGQFENYDFHFPKLCNGKMSTYNDTQNSMLLRNDKVGFEETPMDVDKSIESPNMDIRSNCETEDQSKSERKTEYNNSYDLQMEWQGTDNVENFKTKNRKMNSNTKKHPSKQRSKCSWVKFLFNILIPAAIIYSIIWIAPLYDTKLGAVDNIIKISSVISGTQLGYCADNYDTTLLEKKLQENLYGQSDVVKHLPEYLNFKNNFQLIVFTGGTGVGKTYTKSMIMNTFLWKSNIRQSYRMTDLGRRRQKVHLYNSLSTCGYNLIIIEDLLKEDLNDVTELTEDLFAISTNKNMKTILILTYNIQEITSKGMKTDVDGSTNEIVQKFKTRFDPYFEFKVLKFQTLKLKSLIKCLNASEKRFSVSVPREIVEEIAINMSHFGCKNADQKLLVWSTRQHMIKK